LESRSVHASFDVSLFRNRGYAVSLVAVTLSFFALSGVTFSLPFYLQILRGYDTLTAGLFFVPFAVGQLLAAPRSAKMVERFGYRTVMTTGLVVVAISMLGLLNLQLDSPAWYMLLTFFAFGFGMGNVIAPASTVMQNVLPMARVGAGSAVQNTVRQVGGALGVAVIGTVLATQYSSNMKAVFAQTTGIPEQLQATASQSIISAASVVDQIQQATGLPIATLQAGAFEAFLSAAHVASAISLGIVIIAALVVGFGLPKITPPSSRPLAPATGDGQTPIPAEGA
jgi:DHA2 family multidrug resistance protein-like MFS transporter